jgi:NAD(P)-dependent dehydrogenase (short-subunit alcohol dehydrogenase family)
LKHFNGAVDTDLKAAGVTAKGYPTDLTDSAAVKATIAAVQKDLGPVNLLFWNPVSAPAGLLTATPEQLDSAYDVTVTGGRDGVGWGGCGDAGSALVTDSGGRCISAFNGTCA